MEFVLKICDIKVSIYSAACMCHIKVTAHDRNISKLFSIYSGTLVVLGGILVVLFGFNRVNLMEY